MTSFSSVPNKLHESSVLYSGVPCCSHGWQDLLALLVLVLLLLGICGNVIFGIHYCNLVALLSLSWGLFCLRWIFGANFKAEI